MFSVPEFKFSALHRAAIVGAAAALLAACSADMQRFSSYPGVENTSSLPSRTASRDDVSSRPLDGNRTSNVKPSWQTGYSRNPQPGYAPQSRTAYSPPAAASTGTITVSRGQTLYSIARANGMTTQQVASANNIHAPYHLKVGQRLRMPGVANPVSPAPSFQPETVVATSARATSKNYSSGGVHRVTAGETLFAIGRTYSVHPYKIAAHNNLARPYNLSVGQSLRIPSRTGATAWNDGGKPATGQRTAAVQATKTERLTTQPVEQVATPPAPEVAQPAPVVEQNITKPEDRISPETARFRWPVRGRVISAYGSKPGGARNEGINIAVPEGTSVKASDAGVVAYAGNELKGYGNLVLIRHEGGWVTAYAHNQSLMVKRGDTVRRGEIIAKAGQTGSVTSPQLHFELRKGASAVDPMKYMSSQTASY